MKSFFVLIGFCFFTHATGLSQKKETVQGTGLHVAHLKQQAPVVHAPMVSKVHKAHLYMPKVHNPLVKVHQNMMLSQNFYPQTTLKPAFSDHNRWMNQQLLLGNNQRDLLVDRVIDAAIGRLFGVD